MDVILDPMIAQQLAGTYRVDAPLGRGGMGKLYKATHMRLESKVAIKVLHERLSRHELAIDRFQREAEALARITSPYVCRVLDSVQSEEGLPCLVLELLDGEDMSDRVVKKGPLSAEELLEVCAQLAEGLAAVHAAGIIHRDLKPSNVFLSKDGRARVLDFGVAHVEGESTLTKDGTVVGTPAYMAPEQVLGARQVDLRADLYGLGAVLYFAATGTAPYDENSATKVLAEVLKSPPPPPSERNPEILPALESFIMRAMSRDPRARFDSATEMGEAARKLRDEIVGQRPHAELSPLKAGAALGVSALTIGTALSVPFAGWIGAAASAAVGLLLARLWQKTPERQRGDRFRRDAFGLGRAALTFLMVYGAITLLRDASVLQAESHQTLGIATFAALIAFAHARYISRTIPSTKPSESGRKTSSPLTSSTRPAIHETRA